MPAGWAPRTTEAGTGWRAETATIDRRDRTGALLVRFRHEPATGGTDDAALAAAIDGYRGLSGAVVTVTRPAHRSPEGLRAADWTVDVPVGARRRTALVTALVLNGRVITCYASAPYGAGPAAWVLHGHATDLIVHTHIGTDAG